MPYIRHSSATSTRSPWVASQRFSHSMMNLVRSDKAFVLFHGIAALCQRCLWITQTHCQGCQWFNLSGMYQVRTCEQQMATRVSSSLTLATTAISCWHEIV